MEPLLQAKTICMLVLGIVSLIIGLLPIWLATHFNWKNNSQTMSARTKNILSALLCFGAGVLICTGFTHLLPEVHEGIAELQKKHYIMSNVPVAEIIFSAGFFLVYFVEEFVQWISDKHAHKKTDVSKQVVPPYYSNATFSWLFHGEKTLESLENNRSDKINGYHHHHHHAQGDGDRVMPSIRGLLAVVGISLHEIFEGMAIGLEGYPADVYALFAAVASHKFVIIFCVGLDMATSGVKVSMHAIYMIVLASTTSLGIGIGMAITESGWHSDALTLASLVLQGLAGGTLIYVAFFEVLERERTKSTVFLLQWASLLFGFLALIGLHATLPAHVHGHSHGHSHEHHHDHNDQHFDHHEDDHHNH